MSKYTVNLSTEKPDTQYAFTVKRITATLPQPVWEGSVEQAIVAAIPPHDDCPGWSWTQLDDEQKVIIGNALQSYPLDTWVWCALFSTNPAPGVFHQS